MKTLKWEDIILIDIADIKNTVRDDIALTYACCLTSNEGTDFSKINKAIVARWSRNALTYIKEKAWKLVEEDEVTE